MTIFSRLHHPFEDDKDLNLLRVIKLVTSTGRDLMYQVFKFGCRNKNPNMNFKEYLMTQKNMTEREYKSMFNDNSMRQKIIKNPSGELFDVPLLLRVIKVSCDNMEHKDSLVWSTVDWNKLEFLLTSLKNERNELVHELPAMTESEMQQKIDYLGGLLKNILNKACDRFNIDDNTRSRKITELESDIVSARNSPLTDEQKEAYPKQLRLEHGIKTLKNDGAEELKNIPRNLLNPVSYVHGYDTKVEIDNVFSDMEFELFDHIHPGQTVSHKEILNLIEEPIILQPNNIRPGQYTHHHNGFIIIIGHSGSGKSTLLQRYMNEWTKLSTDILELSDYDLVLPVKCFEQHCKSLAELLADLLPNTCAIIGDDVCTYAQNLRLLIVIDGIEEMNESSRKLVHEILHLGKNNQNTILCTSRFWGSHGLNRRVPEQYKKIHLEIADVTSDTAKNVIMNYHNHFVDINRSHQSTAGLMQYLDSVVDPNFCKSFSNLIHLCYMWAFNVVTSDTTMTQLYNLLHKMREQRIIQRVLQQDIDRNLNDKDVKSQIKAFMSIIYKQALLSLQPNLIFPYPISEGQLNGEYFRECISTFLKGQTRLTNIEIEEEYCIQYQGIFEYYVAQGLFLAITNDEFYHSLIQETSQKFKILGPDSEQKNIHSLLRFIHRDRPLNEINLLGVFKHLAGLMSNKEFRNHEILAKELFNLFNEIGIISLEKWIIIMEETRLPQQTVQCIVSSYLGGNKNITITSNCISSYTALLPFMTPEHVTIDLDQDPDNVPHLKQLLKVISEKNCSVDLLVWDHFNNPQDKKTTDDLLKLLLHPTSKCRLQNLRGQLSGDPLTDVVGVNLQSVHLAIRDDQQASQLITSILQLPHSFKELRVMPTVTVSSLSALPLDTSTICLDLTHLAARHVIWAAQVAHTLAPQNRLHTVKLPEWGKGTAVGLQLQEELDNLHIIVDNFLPCSYLKKVREEETLDLPSADSAQFTSVMKFTNPKSLSLNIDGDPEKLAELGRILDIINQKDCRVELQIHQQNNNSETEHVITDNPVVTETTVPTDNSVPNDTSIVTDTPVVTNTAITTDTPVPNDTPIVTETPVVTDTAITTDTPVPIDTPIVTETPVVTDTAITTDTPVPKDNHVPKDNPVAPTSPPAATNTSAPTKTALKTGPRTPTNTQGLDPATLALLRRDQRQMLEKERYYSDEFFACMGNKRK